MLRTLALLAALLCTSLLHAADRMPAVWQQGTLPNSTPVVQDMRGAPMQSTVTLDSAAGGRKIEFSTNGGSIWQQPTTYDYSSAGELIVFFNATVTHVRFTGTTADTWSIR